MIMAVKSLDSVVTGPVDAPVEVDLSPPGQGGHSHMHGGGSGGMAGMAGMGGGGGGGDGDLSTMPGMEGLTPEQHAAARGAMAGMTPEEHAAAMAAGGRM